MFDNVKLAEEVVASGAENRPRIIGSTASLWVSTGCGKHRDVEDQGCSGSPGGWLQNKPEGGPGWNLARVRRAVSAVRKAEVRGGLPRRAWRTAWSGTGRRRNGDTSGPHRPRSHCGRPTLPVARTDPHGAYRRPQPRPKRPRMPQSRQCGGGSVTRWKPPPHASISVR